MELCFPGVCFGEYLLSKAPVLRKTSFNGDRQFRRAQTPGPRLVIGFHLPGADGPRPAAAEGSQAAHSPRLSRLRLLALYLVMGPLELYGRLRGVYRPRCGGVVWPVKNRQLAQGGVVACFGDSLTEGFGAPPGMSYPEQLARMLAAAGHNVEVRNLGRSGDTAADGRARLGKDVLSLRPLPTVVVLGFGGNDLIRRRPIEETFADLRAMVEQLHKAGCMVVLLGLRGSWLYRVDYETPFYDLARETGCALVPLCLDGIWGVPWRMCDVAHPNARGYRQLAGKVFRGIPLVDANC